MIAPDRMTPTFAATDRPALAAQVKSVCDRADRYSILAGVAVTCGREQHLPGCVVEREDHDAAGRVTYGRYRYADDSVLHRHGGTLTAHDGTRKEG